MATPQPRLGTCCVWLILLVVGVPAFCAEPAKEEPLPELVALDRLVGAWVFQPDAVDGFSARQECKWILNRHFLEIDTRLLRPGHPPASWRTLVTYDKTANCYRQWKFSDQGIVSTEQGTWDEKKSTLKLTGRTPLGNESESRFKIVDDDTLQVDVREYLDQQRSRIAVVSLTLSRVLSRDGRQPTK